MRIARRLLSSLLLSAAVVCLPLAFRASSGSEGDSFLISNAQLADGTGAALLEGALRVRSNRIVSVGKLSPAPGEKVIDAHGLILAPGFIDIHNHSVDGLDADPLAETQVAQGITTAVQGPDGDSPWPIAAWIEARRKNPAAMNLAVLAGHATIREQVMGKDYKRIATGPEIEKMAELAWQAMNEGAVGISSGLEYDVGSYSNTVELVAMARSAAEHGGFYSTHIRDEADKSFDALVEEIEIAEKAHIPVDHSHLKLGTVAVWGKAWEYIRVI
jgi:N-acyl-D-amino-acid deacylase